MIEAGQDLITIKRVKASDGNPNLLFRFQGWKTFYLPLPQNKLDRFSLECFPGRFNICQAQSPVAKFAAALLTTKEATGY
jgi:hypothetical protein